MGGKKIIERDACFSSQGLGVMGYLPIVLTTKYVRKGSYCYINFVFATDVAFE